ncbi:MAG: hypothetical protein A4E54_02803 [Pelotomaculum sp. PtaB.Bin117]|nr:MAG: hypothetical protein A4E54_02803 [Pelotomaculum sp. PtaB.Bin117]OPY63339.1 MAG: hypothetical protein A4E56_00689 [Pelotomaculum sp. PtaU1.Bin065]
MQLLLIPINRFSIDELPISMPAWNVASIPGIFLSPLYVLMPGSVYASGLISE